jgi:hypothetical protein
MKLAYHKRVTRISGLVLAAGLLLSLAPRADATHAGGAAGTNLTVAIQNVLTSSMLAAQPVGRKVEIPKKVVCRSPFKPPSWVPTMPPSWAPGQVKKIEAEPPWKKWTQTKRNVKKK